MHTLALPLLTLVVSAGPAHRGGLTEIPGLERVVGWTQDESIAILQASPPRLGDVRLYQLDLRRPARAVAIDADSWSASHPTPSAHPDDPCALNSIEELSGEEDPAAA